MSKAISGTSRRRRYRAIPLRHREMTSTNGASPQISKSSLEIVVGANPIQPLASRQDVFEYNQKAAREIDVDRASGFRARPPCTAVVVRRRLAGDDDRGAVGRQLFEQEDDGRRRRRRRCGGVGSGRRVHGDDGFDELGRDALAESRTASLAHARRTPVPAASHQQQQRRRRPSTTALTFTDAMRTLSKLKK